MIYDRYGYPISAASEDAAALYRDGVDLMLSAWDGGSDRLHDALTADPEFALAHAALARWHAMHADMERAVTHAQTAVKLAGEHGDAREQSHADIIQKAVTGRPAEALAGVLEHIETWPGDAVILSLPLGAFGLYAFSGMKDHNEAKAELCERMARHYASDDWWFLTYHGWSIAEAGEVSRGRAMLEAAMDYRIANANGAHSLAHCMVEGGDGDAVIQLISGWLPEYPRESILHGHIAWHHALALLERGDADEAYEVYQRSVRPSASLGVPINRLTDAVSFLWRHELYGHETSPDDWKSASDYGEAHFPKAGHRFIDTHRAIGFAGAGERAKLDEMITALEEIASLKGTPQSDATLAMADGISAYQAGEFTRAADSLGAVMDEVVRIGGSNAQREIIEDTYIQALMRGGQIQRARTALTVRLDRRPSPRDSLWLSQIT